MTDYKKYALLSLSCLLLALILSMGQVRKEQESLQADSPPPCCASTSLQTATETKTSR